MFLKHQAALGFFILLFLSPFEAKAQLTPDHTLGNETSIVNKINNFVSEINGGSVRGNQLFHSFQEFNIDRGKTVIFNSSGIENIFTRVTGRNASNIFGTLKVNGNANLLLMNPNGIIFGKEARLDLNNSFIGTTASSLFFNGFEFNATNPQNIPFGIKLSSSPIGGFHNTSIKLNFTGNNGDIIVSGNGHQLQNEFGKALQGRSEAIGLEVSLKKNIALIGTNISMINSILTAEGGKIEISAIKLGEVIFDKNWNFDYQKVLNFGEINFSQRTLVDTSSQSLSSNSNQILSSGSIKIQAAKIGVNDESIFLIQNRGMSPSGNIMISSSESINFSRSILSNSIPNVSTEALGLGKSGDIIISSPSIGIDRGALRTSTYDSGAGGSIFISTNNLRLQNSGNISTITTSKGRGGSINIESSKKVEIVGDLNSLEGVTTGISTNTIGPGNGGNFFLSTKNLLLKDGAGIGTISFLDIGGKAGNVDIFADTIELAGQTIFGSDVLQSRIRSESRNKSDAGNINLNSNYVNLNNGQISSTSANSLGGNIDINANTLFLRNNSLISTTAFGDNPGANGGNININADLTILLNSNIFARAVRGRGGDISISGSGVFLDSFSSIDASSQFGQDGTITIDVPQSL
ncbi:MAG: filamentous hemagglutinin N-terminal domain-containing protein, partial [Prochloraceae cyanobacterium]